jgi:hypothetical protein
MKEMYIKSTKTENQEILLFSCVKKEVYSYNKWALLMMALNRSPGDVV